MGVYVTISNVIFLFVDYKGYFGVSYSNTKVTITLAKSLPDKVLDENASITLKIKAEKEDEEVLAALVIKLPKSQSNKNDFEVT